MPQSKTIFFGIIALAIAVVIGMAAVGSFLTDSLDLPTNSGEIDIQIMVAPSIKPWVDQAARDFNQANPKSQVKVIATNNLLPDSQFQSTNPDTTPPAAWLAEASFAIEMATSSGLQFEDAQSVASTHLAWGMYNSKLDQLTRDYGDLSWDNLHAKGSNDSDVLKLVIASPQNSAEGLAALISATAAHIGTESLSANDISAADAWLTETFGNRNAQIPATPAGDFATKGVSAGDVGILTLASWQSSRLHERSDFAITPTQPQVVLDYPFAIWSGSRPEAKAAAKAFREFLLEADRQTALGQRFLNPAGTDTGGVQIDGTAAQRLLDWASRQLR